MGCPWLRQRAALLRPKRCRAVSATLHQRNVAPAGLHACLTSARLPAPDGATAPHLRPAAQACQLRQLRDNAAATASGPDCHLIGSVAVHELDWDCAEHAAALREPPAEVVMAADCVYNEEIVPALLATMHALAGPDTLVLISLELRSGACAHPGHSAAALRLRSPPHQPRCCALPACLLSCI